MRILLFNLGTIEHRILSWEIDGFKSLFEQDIILWGPIPDKHFTYNGKEIPILGIFEEVSISRLFAQLPEGWIPDVIACDTSALNYVPDIYKSPAKTIIFTRDSWSDTVFNRGLVEFFDFLNSSTVDRSLYRRYHVNMLPLKGFAVSTPGHDSLNSEFEKRDIDVIAIANYESSFYHERHKIFYKLSESNNGHFKINFVRSVKRSGIYNYYQKSKIVLDWAHTLSNRSYEAALNGCLLFSHEDNRVMSEFWVPLEEYIPYNENNLPELVSYYLNHPDLAKKIAGNAKKKIMTVPATWGEMAWDRIFSAHETEVSINDRIRYNESLPISALHYRTATPLLYNYDYGKDFPANWRELYFIRIDNAISFATSDNERISPLIEASRAAFLFGKTESAVSYLMRLQEILPDYAWTYYMRARIFYKKGENSNAIDLLEKAVSCGTKAPELLQRYILPLIEKGNSCDGQRITNYMWQSVYNHDNEFQVKALFHLSMELLGTIYMQNGDKEKAKDSYLNANEYITVPDCIANLSPLLIELKDYNRLSEVTLRGLADSPYDSILTFYRAYALIWSGQKREACDVLRRHRAALKSFVGIRQITLIRIAVSIMIPLIYVARRTCSFVIIALIKRLRIKAGFTYLD